MENLTIDLLDEYVEIAVPYSEIPNAIVQEVFKNGKVVYLYGDYTIQEYKSYFGIERFGSYETIYDENGDEIEKQVFMSLGEDDTTKYQVIGYSNQSIISGEYLAGIEVCPEEETILPYQYFIAVSDNFIAKHAKTRSVILRKSNYNITNYYDSSCAFTALSWRLYQETAETDPSKDYFAIQTDLWADTSRPGYIIYEDYIKYSLPYNATDFFYQSAPGSNTGGTKSITGSISLGPSGPTGSLTVTSNFQDTTCIYRTEDYSNGTIDWKLGFKYPIDPSPFKTPMLDKQVFHSTASWASSGSLAKINISFKSSTEAAAHILQVKQGWQQVT